NTLIVDALTDGLPYFLAVSAIVQRIREQDILVACRGSAAGSLIAYTLRISDVNPMHYGLIMERFLHEYRTDLPDIDLDVESHRREAIQRDLIDTWGANRVTGLAMVATFRARSAIREVGKAIGLPEQDINLAAKAFPRTRAARISHLAATLPEAQGLGLNAPPFQRLFAIAERLDGLPRNLALHPCGLILANADLGDIAPLIPSGPRDNGDTIAMVPYDKDDIEDLGLVKLDLLGVRMLSAMTHAKRLAEHTRGVHIDFDLVDATPDPATFSMIQRSDTIGMFQIESPGQRELIGRLTPQNTHDLVIDISLFRPGPVKGDMIEPFLRRREGHEPVDLPPLLAPILAETYGVIVYHEQVIRCISAITGCDLGQADIARRNLGNTHALPAMEDWIRSWCQCRGITQAVTDWLWHSLAQFASFGFCKAHAAAFSVPTYRSAWLKANMMPEFLAGVLTHDPGMYPARLIYAEARRHGIIPLGVSINHSQATYTVTRVLDPYTPDTTFIDGDYGQAPPSHTGQRHRWAIRPALTCIRGIDMTQITSICAGQPFHSIEDVHNRTQLHTPVAFDLARIGAFDEIAPTLSRGDIQIEVEERWATQPRKRHQHPANTAQLRLFSADPPVGLPALRPAHQIRAEVEVTGIDMSQHIIDWYTHRVPDTTKSADLMHVPNGQRVRIIGAKVASQTPPTKSGKRIIFLTLDDGTGLADITFFPWAHHECARTVFTNWLMAVEGRVQRRGRLPTIIGERVWPLNTQPMPHQLWHASAGSSG
uniref:helix-hairpin-helix domain-containing protein n=1 Tax=Stomatohabitans albus TaxID=3110766 RepID=UPI00300D0B12